MPPTSPQVLRTCAQAPAVIEVLFNSYAQLRVSESWLEVVPEEVYQVRSGPSSTPCSRTQSLSFLGLELYLQTQEVRLKKEGREVGH